MSRRHHGGRPHRANGPGRPVDTSRPLGPAVAPDHQPASNPAAVEPAQDARGPVAPTTLPGERIRSAAPAMLQEAPPSVVPDRDGQEPLNGSSIAPEPSAVDHEVRHEVRHESAPPSPAASDHRPAMNGARPPIGQPLGPGGACTAPQLRRFIKSRPYVPMHELRRRFGIDGGEDDVTSVDLASGRIYVGLPSREGSLLGELLRGGEVGFELSLDPRSPVVVGLYPMRPVARN